MADRKRTRWPFIVGPFCIALVGYTAVLSIPHPALPGLTYFFLFFITAGLYPSIIGTIAWTSNNLAPNFKRAIGMALLMTMGNLGGAVGSNIFIATQAPHCLCSLSHLILKGQLTHGFQTGWAMDSPWELLYQPSSPRSSSAGILGASTRSGILFLRKRQGRDILRVSSKITLKFVLRY